MYACRTCTHIYACTQLRQRLEAAERALAQRDADVARLRQDKGRLEAEADDVRVC